MKLISIVTGCFNEEENVDELHRRLLLVRESLPQYRFEHIFIDNASTDDTVGRIKALIARDPAVRLIVNARNFGHIRSPYHAIMQAGGDAVISMASRPAGPSRNDPGDGQEVGGRLPDRRRRQGQCARVEVHVAGQVRLYHRVARKMADAQLLEHFTGFGMYDRRVIDVMRILDDPYPYFRGMIAEIGFEVARSRSSSRRVRGITKNNFYTLYDLAMLGITSHSKIPIRLATMTGFALSIVSFAISLAYLVLKLLIWNELPAGTAPLLIGMFFFGSVQIFFIGLIGEYVAAIHTQVMRRPRSSSASGSTSMRRSRPAMPEGGHTAAIDHGRAGTGGAGLTSAVALVARAAAVLTSLVTLPLTAHYLGKERFGLWMTISSFMALLAFADLGIGNGLLTTVAAARGSDDVAAIRRAISSALVVLTVLAVLVAAVLAFPVAVVDWAGMFGLQDPLAIAEVRPSLFVFLLAFALAIPLSVVGHSQNGMQMGFIAASWQIAGSIAALAGILAVIHLQGPLTWLLAALLGGPLLASALNTATFFAAGTHPWRPGLRYLTRAEVANLLRYGSLYFLLQIAVSIAYASDNAILARAQGAQAVGDFAVAAKLFAVATMLVGIALQPLWPAYAEAQARGDARWIRRTVVRSTLVAALLAAVVSGTVLAGFHDIVALWMQRSVSLPRPLLLGLALWAVVDAVGISIAMCLNGLHVVRLQVVLATAFAVSCFMAKLWLVPRYGAVALPWCTVVPYVTISLLPVLLMTRRWLPATIRENS